MSIEKTRPVGNLVPPTKESTVEQKKDSRPNLIERLADLQEASGALENLRKGTQNTGITADKHTDHNDSHTDHDNHADGHSDRPHQDRH